jgi:hypothetical protein
MLEKVQPRVTQGMNEKLLSPFSPEDEKKAAFSIGDYKKLLDRMDFMWFFKKKNIWNICGEEITQEILQAMNS